MLLGAGGCEWGDKTPGWCSSILTEQCYTVESTCCKTCHDHLSGPVEPSQSFIRFSVCYFVAPWRHDALWRTEVGPNAIFGLNSRKFRPHRLCRSAWAVCLFVRSIINKNLAIANRSRVSCINTNNNTMTLKSGLDVTQGHLKMVLFESFGTVSYSPSIVTMAVSAANLEIFSVKEWPDLEIWVWGPPRSLKMALFDRPYMTSY